MGAERWEAETHLCLTPLSGGPGHSGGEGWGGGGGERGRSFRPEIRGMPGLKKKKNNFGPFGP